MKIIYLDQNVFSRMAEASGESRLLLLLKKLVRRKRIVIPLTDAHIRETAKTTDDEMKNAIWRLQAELTQGIHFSLPERDKLSINFRPELFAISPTKTEKPSKATLHMFKALQKQTREALLKNGIDSKTLNHCSTDELIKRFEDLLKNAPPAGPPKQDAALVETALNATAGFIKDLWPGELGILAAEQFRQQAQNDMAHHSATDQPKDLKSMGTTIANIYNSTGSLFITPPAGIFLFLSHAGYWTDINKPLEIEDAWHLQYSWFAHHFISADQRLLKRFELTKAIFGSKSPKLHNLLEYMVDKAQ